MKIRRVECPLCASSLQDLENSFYCLRCNKQFKPEEVLDG